MTIRPIIFSAPMVRALLEGRKTQTRRLATSPLRKCEPGYLLYVREAWAPVNTSDGPAFAYRADKATYQPEYDGLDEGAGPTFDYGKYPADYSMWYEDLLSGEPDHRWTPSIHMPRWASRLTLRVTCVRTEPLWSISDNDIRAEGVSNAFTDKLDPLVTCWKRLWNSLHDKPGERWEDNPQIVALTFKVIRENVDRIEAANREDKDDG